MGRCVVLPLLLRRPPDEPLNRAPACKPAPTAPTRYTKLCKQSAVSRPCGCSLLTTGNTHVGGNPAGACACLLHFRSGICMGTQGEPPSVPASQPRIPTPAPKSCAGAHPSVPRLLYGSLGEERQRSRQHHAGSTV